MLPLIPQLDVNKKDPLYTQLYNYLKEEIRSKHIPAHSKLPSQRQLAHDLQVSRNTVDAAYQQLLTEGYIQSEARKGLFVVEIRNSFDPAASSNNAAQQDSIEESVRNKSIPSMEGYDFKYGDVDIAHFPFKSWRRFAMKSLTAEEGSLLLYGEPQGERQLRKYIASYLSPSRGVNCSEDQIVIGAGTQCLLSLLCKIIGKDLVYAMEEPGYDRVRLVLKDYGKRVVPICLDEQGFDVGALSRSEAKVVYVTPSHQFPSGTVMSISRRLELMDWARRTGGYIIEDDYDSEFRYEGKPIPSLQSLDRDENVVYMGTFAKSLIPSLRMGFMVLPVRLLAVYREQFIGYKQTVSRLHQHTLTHFIESGEWSRHLKKARSRYKKRHQAILAAIQERMGDRVRIQGSASGLHLLLESDNGMTEDQLIAAAKNKGVNVYPVSPYYEMSPASAPAQVLLGFAGIDEKRISEGIRLLAEAWFE
ncbi:PLP-dependent aminotransferase family protein [Cohnella boryungensis]|uniref:PLP-dependent aminotransferase family protein n=1 Tax=Cohnella boryungensis TaxID=768479 RepID=A0ABV8S9Z9_9BACL